MVLNSGLRFGLLKDVVMAGMVFFLSLQMSYASNSNQIGTLFQQQWPPSKLQNLFRSTPQKRVRALVIRGNYTNGNRDYLLHYGVKENFTGRYGEICREYIFKLDRSVRVSNKVLDKGVICEADRGNWVRLSGAKRSDVEKIEEAVPAPEPVRPKPKATKKKPPSPPPVLYKTSNLFVRLSDKKANNKKWDLSVLPSVSSPDLMICIEPINNKDNHEEMCVIQENKGAVFYTQKSLNEHRVPTSRENVGSCQNTHNCTFKNIPLPPHGFNFAVYDFDLRDHDLAGFGACYPEEGCEWQEKEGNGCIGVGKNCQIADYDPEEYREEVIQVIEDKNEALFNVIRQVVLEKTNMDMQNCGRVREGESVNQAQKDFIRFVVKRSAILNNVYERLFSPEAYVDLFFGGTTRTARKIVEEILSGGSLKAKSFMRRARSARRKLDNFDAAFPSEIDNDEIIKNLKRMRSGVGNESLGTGMNLRGAYALFCNR